MKKKLLMAGVFITNILSAQNLTPTTSISASGSVDNFKGGYTFAYESSGTPWSGSLLSFGGFSNNYDTQISANYGGNNISFRTRNGDRGFWNPWNELATKGANNFTDQQTIMGNLGVGTNAPQARLDVNFGGEPKTIKFLESSNAIHSMNSMVRFTWYDNTADLGIVRSDSYPIEAMAIRFNQNEVVRFTPNGNALVQGKLEAKEVKVTSTPTADFVFEENYDLPKLEEIEKHIKEKKHLPEIASAKEMEKDGVNVGAFQIKLLQKIEELTLYSIEQNKRLLKLEEDNRKLNIQVEDLKTKK